MVGGVLDSAGVGSEGVCGLLVLSMSIDRSSSIVSVDWRLMQPIKLVYSGHCLDRLPCIMSVCLSHNVDCLVDRLW